MVTASKWLLNDDVALLTDPTLEALSDALCHLLQDDAARQALCRRAQEFARHQHWKASAEAFEQGLLEARKLLSVVAEEAV
ncbi:group 1 glycosyl transferase [Alicycliphilus sp. B1]|nr:group 1 glycosyl transferase [Alicycliphilus sp. B1]